MCYVVLCCVVTDTRERGYTSMVLCRVVTEANDNDYSPTATAYTGKSRERFWRNEGEWTRKVEIREEEILGSRRSMHGYILTYSRL